MLARETPTTIGSFGSPGAPGPSFSTSSVGASTTTSIHGVAGSPAWVVAVPSRSVTTTTAVWATSNRWPPGSAITMANGSGPAVAPARASAISDAAAPIITSWARA